MKRVWSVFAAMSLVVVGFTAYAQTADVCSENRGAIRAGKEGTAPVYDPAAPTVVPLTFDEFQTIQWNDLHKGDFEPGELQTTRIDPEETTIYQIDGLELRSTITCNGQTRLELGKPGTSTNAAIIFALTPADACMAGSPYEQATTSAIDTFLEKYSAHAEGDKDACFGSLDSEKNGRLLRVIGVGNWSTDEPPQFGINPILSIVELDDDGNPLGGGTGAVATLPFQVAFPDDMGTEPIVLGNAASQTVAFNTVATSTFSNDLHLSVTSDAADTDDFHVSVSPDVIVAPGTGQANVVIETTPDTRPRQYIVTVAATSIDAATGVTQTSSNTFIVDLRCTPPFILGSDQAQPVTAPNGTSATVSVTASGTGPYRYQWYRGFRGMTFSPVEGATSNTLTVPALGTELYWVRISNACGSVDSNSVFVTGQ